MKAMKKNNIIEDWLNENGNLAIAKKVRDILNDRDLNDRDMIQVYLLWGNDEIYFIPTISLHLKYRIVQFCFLKCVVEVCY